MAPGPTRRTRRGPTRSPRPKGIRWRSAKPRPTWKLPADWFTEDARADIVQQGGEPSRLRATMVRFAPGARTAWPSHDLGQTLPIVEGVALVQARGGDIVETHPGDMSTRA